MREEKLFSWPRGAEAAVTLTFDGGYSKTVEAAAPLLLEAGYCATWFLVSGAVGKELEGRPVAPWSVWRDMAASGMELGSHTVSHPRLKGGLADRTRGCLRKCRRLVTSFTGRKIVGTCETQQEVDELRMCDEAVGAARAIEQAVAGLRVVSFAYPHGRYSQHLIRMLEDRGFWSARTTDDGINTYPVARYKLLSKVVTRRTSGAVLDSWVARAVEMKGWLIETYHLVTEQGEEDYYWEIRADQLRRHLESIAKQRVWVATQREVSAWLLGVMDQGGKGREILERY